MNTPWIMHEEMEHPRGLQSTQPRRSQTGPGMAPVNSPPGGLSHWEKNYEDLVAQPDTRSDLVDDHSLARSRDDDHLRPRVWNVPD